MSNCYLLNFNNNLPIRIEKIATFAVMCHSLEISSYTYTNGIEARGLGKWTMPSFGKKIFYIENRNENQKGH